MKNQSEKENCQATCHNQLWAHQKFCERCGLEVNAHLEAGSICTHFHTDRLRRGHKFCHNCGAELSKTR